MRIIRRRNTAAAWVVAGVIALPGSVMAQRPPVFDPARDYAYDLAATDAAVFEVALAFDGFAWPANVPAADTAFLELHVTATGPGESEVSTRSGEVEVRQVFEENCDGRRFLDVSPLLGTAAENRVTMQGSEAVWKTGAARLFVYANPNLRDERVLVLAPHPDDAEIAAFGVYGHTGADVITVTAGDAGSTNFSVLYSDPGEHYRVKGWIRTWDSISVPFYGGVPPGKARNLGFYDATLAKLHDTPGSEVPPPLAELDEPAYYRSFNVDTALRDRPFRSTWGNLVADIAWELERVQPSVILAPHPMLDAHPDHQFVTIALIDALEGWGGDCELYLYTNHGTENEAYPLGDRHARSGLPAWSGGDLFFSRLVVYPLTPDDQKLKLIALESMHDLRDFDIGDNVPTLNEAELWERERYNYFRRGPRPNELFYVVTREDAVQLKDAFLRAREEAVDMP